MANGATCGAGAVQDDVAKPLSLRKPSGIAQEMMRPKVQVPLNFLSPAAPPAGRGEAPARGRDRFLLLPGCGGKCPAAIA